MTPLSGKFWRVRFVADDATLIAPAATPEGRFHHSGQTALYLSGSAEGAVIATMTYVGPGDAERAVYPLAVAGARVIDLRDPIAVARHGLDVTHRAARWQEDRAAGRPARTWAISDAARATGADGILYASRKRPDLAHLALFRWNEPGAARVTRAGDPRPFAPAG